MIQVSWVYFVFLMSPVMTLIGTVIVWFNSLQSNSKFPNNISQKKYFILFLSKLFQLCSVIINPNKFIKQYFRLGDHISDFYRDRNRETGNHTTILKNAEMSNILYIAISHHNIILIVHSQFYLK